MRARESGRCSIESMARVYLQYDSRASSRRWTMRRIQPGTAVVNFSSSTTSAGGQRLWAEVWGMWRL